MSAVHSYFDGINAERYDDVGALFAPDAVMIAPGVSPRRGPSEVADYFRSALARYPEHYDDPTRIIEAGATVTVEIHFTGRLENGQPIEFDAVDVFDLDGEGRIVRLSSWYDSHAVRKAVRTALEADGRPAAR